MANRWTQIGHLPVDSGTFALCDGSYTDLRDAPSPLHGKHIQYPEGIMGFTYEGDGVYPVYADLDAKGRIRRLMVDFVSRGDSSEESEEEAGARDE